ncbi:HSP20-like chaperone [Baffinella frigidus]|nr:HSP20-like chaperone [Cryptophyta sp. CCMP2293]
MGKRGLALSSAVLVASVALALIPAVPAWSGQPERLGAVPQQATLLRAAPALLERVPCVLELRGGDGVHLPIVAWSQRQETLTLKIDVPVGVTCSADNVKVEEQAVRWHEEKVGLDLELWGKLDVSSAIVRSDGGRVVTVTAKKATEGWWDKVSSGPKSHNVKIDWASWKDEDEEDEAPAEEAGGGMGGGGMPGMPGGMGGMPGGMPGMGGAGGDGDFNFDDMDMDKDGGGDDPIEEGDVRLEEEKTTTGGDAADAAGGGEEPETMADS